MPRSAVGAADASAVASQTDNGRGGTTIDPAIHPEQDYQGWRGICPCRGVPDRGCTRRYGRSGVADKQLPPMRWARSLNDSEGMASTGGNENRALDGKGIAEKLCPKDTDHEQRTAAIEQRLRDHSRQSMNLRSPGDHFPGGKRFLHLLQPPRSISSNHFRIILLFAVILPSRHHMPSF